MVQFTAMAASRTPQMSPVRRYAAAFPAWWRPFPCVFSADVEGWFTWGSGLHVRTTPWAELSLNRARNIKARQKKPGGRFAVSHRGPRFLRYAMYKQGLAGMYLS